MPLRQAFTSLAKIHPNRMLYSGDRLFGLAVCLMFTAVWAELFHFQPFCRGPLILRFAVVAVLAFTALELNDFSWHTFYPSFS
jgi:hypothetical protein